MQYKNNINEVYTHAHNIEGPNMQFSMLIITGMHAIARNFEESNFRGYVFSFQGSNI